MFNDAVSRSHYNLQRQTAGRWVVKCEGYGRRGSMPNLRYYPGICLERLSKTKKILTQYSRFQGQDLNAMHTAYTTRYEHRNLP
jgi:hypothetical protein